MQQSSWARAGSSISRAPHVSPPKCWRQLREAAQVPEGHACVSQSPCSLHVFPVAHFGAAVPPQSMSVSSPFFTPSVGEGGAQTDSLHTRDAQSASERHEPSGMGEVVGSVGALPSFGSEGVVLAAAGGAPSLLAALEQPAAHASATTVAIACRCPRDPRRRSSRSPPPDERITVIPARFRHPFLSPGGRRAAAVP